jgi:hypothetical protein
MRWLSLALFVMESSMACALCNQKGYIESFIHIHAKARPQVKQCRHCNDVKAYSSRIMELLNDKTPQKSHEDKRDYKTEVKRDAKNNVYILRKHSDNLKPKKQGE